MRLKATLLAMVCLTACATGGVAISEHKASSSQFARLVKERRGDVVLRSGAVAAMREAITDYGDVLCDERVCVRKADVTSIRLSSLKRGMPGASAVGAVAAAPAVLVGFGALWGLTCLKEGCGSDGGGTRAVEYLTPETKARRWVDGVVLGVKDAVIRREGNACLANRPEMDDAAALDWIWRNRAELGGYCLYRASQALNGDSDVVDRDRSIRLWALSKIRRQWVGAHCVLEKPAERTDRYRRVAPGYEYPAGAPSPFPIIAEVLADDASYTLPRDTSNECKTGVTAEPSIDRATFAATLDPFSPIGAPTVYDEPTFEEAAAWAAQR